MHHCRYLPAGWRFCVRSSHHMCYCSPSFEVVVLNVMSCGCTSMHIPTGVLLSERQGVDSTPHAALASRAVVQRLQISSRDSSLLSGGLDEYGAFTLEHVLPFSLGPRFGSASREGDRHRWAAIVLHALLQYRRPFIRGPRTHAHVGNNEKLGCMLTFRRYRSICRLYLYHTEIGTPKALIDRIAFYSYSRILFVAFKIRQVEDFPLSS